MKRATTFSALLGFAVLAAVGGCDSAADMLGGGPDPAEREQMRQDLRRIGRLYHQRIHYHHRGPKDWKTLGTNAPSAAEAIGRLRKEGVRVKWNLDFDDIPGFTSEYVLAYGKVALESGDYVLFFDGSVRWLDDAELQAALQSRAAPPPAGAAPALRYKFREGQWHGYHVTLKIETEEYTHTRIYAVLYEVRFTSPERIVATHYAQAEKLDYDKKKPDADLPSRLGEHAIQNGRFAINRQGKLLPLLSASDMKSLPQALGFLEIIPLERLSPEPRRQWRWTDDPKISSGVFAGPFGGTAALEIADYRILDVQGDRVTVEKAHMLRTLGDARLTLAGTGQFVFDQRRGLLTSLSMKYRIQDKNTTTQKTDSATASVECRLLGAAPTEKLAEKWKDTVKVVVGEPEPEPKRPEPEPKPIPANDPPPTAAPRTWSDASGKFHVEAKLVSQADGVVTLQSTDGKLLEVPLARLSEADRAFLADHAAPSPAPTPPTGKPRDTKLIGGPGGFEFREAGKRPLVGVRYSLGGWGGEKAVGRLVPLAARDAEPISNQTILARPGYALGGVKIVSKNLVNAVQLVFMRQKPDGSLDPSDSYTSDWIGDPGDKTPQKLGGTGAAVVGFHGRRGIVIDALGLVLLEN